MVHGRSFVQGSSLALPSSSLAPPCRGPFTENGLQLHLINAIYNPIKKLSKPESWPGEFYFAFLNTGTCKLNLLPTDLKSLTALKRGSQSFLLRKDRCVASLAPQVMQLLESHFTWARILPTILLHALWVETLRGTRRPTIAQVLNASEHVGRCQQAHQHHGSSVLSVTTHYVLSAAAVDFSWGLVIHHGSWIVGAFQRKQPLFRHSMTKSLVLIQPSQKQSD